MQHPASGHDDAKSAITFREMRTKRMSAGRMQKQLAQLLISHNVAQACRTIAQKMLQKNELPWLLDRTEAALI